VEEGKVGYGFPIWNMLLGYVSHVLLGKFVGFMSSCRYDDMKLDRTETSYMFNMNSNRSVSLDFSTSG
jgi:hypothetical protein